METPQLPSQNMGSRPPPTPPGLMPISKLIIRTYRVLFCALFRVSIVNGEELLEIDTETTRLNYMYQLKSFV